MAKDKDSKGNGQDVPVASSGKRERKLVRERDYDAGTVSFQPVGMDEVIQVSIDEFPSDIVRKLAVEGLNVKAGSNKSGREVMTEIRENIADLKAGIWKTRGMGGAAGDTHGQRFIDLATALSELFNRPYDDVVSSLETMSKEEQREIPKKYISIKNKIKEIRARRDLAQTAGAPTDSDLGSLQEMFA